MKNHILSIGLLLSSFHQLNAQELFDMSIEDLMNIDIQVASKFKDDINTAPSTITVFTDKDIERMGVETLDEILAYAPNISVSQLGDRFAITVRGSRSYAQTLLMVDGQRMNEALFGGFAILSPKISLTNVEKIEIIRGPGSTIYGANAFLAVVNISTKNKTKLISADVGSANKKRFSANFYRQVGQYSISLFTEIYKDSYTFRNYPESFVDGTTRTNSSGVKEIDSRLTAQLKLKRRNTELDIYHEERNLDGGTSADAIAASNEHNQSDPTTSFVALKHKIDINEASDVKLALNLMKKDFKPFGYSGLNSGKERYTGGHVIEHQYRVSGEYKNNLTNKFRFLAGFEYLYIDLIKDESYGNSDSSGTYVGSIQENGELYSGPNIKNYGLYSQTQYDINKNIKLSAGLRFDESSVSDNALSPRFAITSALAYGFDLKLMWGEAFRAPTYGEMFQNSQVVIANKDLKSEKVETREIALFHTGNQHRVGMTYYISRFENQIEAKALGNNTYILANTDRSKREGIEFEFKANLFDNLELNGTYSYVLGIDQVDTTVPDHNGLGSVGLNYRYSKLNVNFNGVYKEAYRELEQDSVFISNLKFLYNYDQDLRFNLNIKNIGNKEYLNRTFVRTNHQANRGRVISAGFKHLF